MFRDACFEVATCFTNIFVVAGTRTDVTVRDGCLFLSLSINRVLSFFVCQRIENL